MGVRRCWKEQESHENSKAEQANHTEMIETRRKIMSEQTKIQWTDSTFNPWIGCTKVIPANWSLPKRWNAAAEKSGNQHRVFCASLADWLDDEVPIEWLADLLQLIYETPHLNWLMLTKRPENFNIRTLSAAIHLAGFRDGQTGNAPIAECQSSIEMVGGWSKWETFPKNVWIGASVENQEMADRRIPELIKIPAEVRFLSVEPMLGPIDLSRWLYRGQIRCTEPYCSFNYSPPDCKTCRGTGWQYVRPAIHWVIFGGESGPSARPCNLEWIREGARQCREAGIKVFVKQLKGGDMAEWPEDLRVREIP